MHVFILLYIEVGKELSLVFPHQLRFTESQAYMHANYLSSAWGTSNFQYLF